MLVKNLQKKLVSNTKKLLLPTIDFKSLYYNKNRYVLVFQNEYKTDFSLNFSQEQLKYKPFHVISHHL